MNKKTLPPILHRLAEIIVVATLYYLTARLGFFMALPPGNVTALWPPSGLALAAVFMCGWQMGIGIFIGSFLVNMGMMSGSAALPVAAAIAIGSTLQAWLGVWVLRRFIKLLPPDSIRETLLSIELLSLTTLLAPIIGVVSLCFAGYAQWSRFFTLAVTWWLGDMIGVLVFAPSLIIFSMRWNKQKVNEPFLWSLTCFLIGLSLFTFFVLRNVEERQESDSLQRDMQEMAYTLQSQIEHDFKPLTSIGAFYTSSQEVNSNNFFVFTAPFLADSSATMALSWVPRVTQPERSDYEQIIRKRGAADFYIYEKDANGNNIPTGIRAEYFPVTFIEPMASNKTAVGFDIGSTPARLETIIRARDGGLPAATAPIHLVQESDDQFGILIMLPVYRNGAPHDTVADRRANLLGLANGVFRINALVDKAFGSVTRKDIEVYLYDVENPDEPQFLAFYPSISGAQTLPATGVPDPASLLTGEAQKTIIKIGGRDWMVLVRPGPAYASNSNQWIAWASLLVGFVVAGAFLTYVNTRQKNEVVLARSAAEFRALSEYALTGVLQQRVFGEITYANKALAQMFGFDSLEDFLSKDIRSYLSDLTQFTVMFEDLKSFGKTRDRQIDIINATGEKRHLLCSASLHKDIVSATLMDITDRVRAETEISQLSRIVSQMADLVIITDVKGVIEYVNPAFEKLTGYSRDEVIGKTPRISKSGLESREFYQRLWNTILRGEVFQGDIRNRKKNGELYYESRTITPIRDASGAITHFVATGQDITERKQIEDALNESKLMFHLLIESLPQNIYAKDVEGRFIFANRHYCTTEGKSLEEIVGKTDFDLHPAELAEKYRQDDQRVIETGVPFEVEEEHAAKDGEIFFVQVIKAPFYDATGQTDGTLGIFWDITERKRSEALVRQQGEQLHLLYEASQRLNRTLDLNEIYQTICDFMSFIASNDGLIISTFDQATQLITCRAYWLDHKWLDVSSFPSIPLEEEGKGTQSIVIHTGKSMLMNDYQTHLRSAHHNYTVDSETNQVSEEAPQDEEEIPRSAMIVPLKTGDMVNGVVQVTSYKLNAYTEDQLKLLEALSLHIVAAEKNAMLYAQVQTELNERKQAEDALHQSELQFRALFELSPDAVMLIDPHDPNLSWPIVDCNKAACLMNGYERDELIGHSVDIINIKPGTEAERNDYLKQLQETGNRKLEAFHRHKSGVVFPVEISTRLTKIGDRELIIGIDRDITERKQAGILQETVYRIAEAAQTSESLQDLYLQIHSQISNVMYADNFYIALYDEASNLLRFVYSIDEIDPLVTEPFTPGNGLTEYVLKTGKPLLCDALKQEELSARGECFSVGAPSLVWLGAPLIANGKTIGVMAVQHYSDAHVFTEREQHILEFVSSQVATAIDRKQAEETLLLTEKRNSALIEHAPGGIALLDMDGKFTFGSPSAYHMFGYTADEVIGHNALQWLPPEDAVEVHEKFVKLVREPYKIFTAEYRFRHKDGTYRWVEGAFDNLLTEPGVKAVVNNFRDITEQKLAHVMLQKSRANLETAQSIAHLGSWELDPRTGAGLSWSKEMFELFQRDPAQGAPALDEFTEMVHPEDRQSLLNAQQRAIETGSPVTIEYRTNFKDGKVRYFKATIQPMKDMQGHLTHMSGTTLDITEIKIAQIELEELNRDLEKRVEARTAEVRKSEATYRALFENSNDGIFLLSPEGEDLTANKQALNMLGYTLEEYKQLTLGNVNAVAAPEQHSEANDRFARALSGEYIPLYERTFIDKNGKRVEVEINLSPVRDVSGKIIMVQSVVRDITGRKKAQEELRESRDKLSAANAALEKASRLKDEFLASMSHELRTPLTGILGLSEALQLQTYGALTEKQLKSIKNIELSGRHLLALINDILDLSKIEAGKLDMQFEPCSVADVCQASLQLTKGMAHQKKINISFSMNPASINIRADMRRLKQMLVNLISNAVKFTPEGGNVGLEVQASDLEKAVYLSVWDKGIGIKPEEIGKLFKPFTQLDSALSRQYSGTGLGLSLVQRMAELHGGSVKVESIPGEGSRFTIILPWSAGVTQPVSDLKQGNTGPLKNTLVIEDNQLDAEQIKRYLKEIGIASIVQPVMRGALEKAALLHPGAILLDLNMPDGFGFELLAQLKADKRTHDIPVIIISIEERRTEAMKLGAVGYLLKPFNQQDLRTELAKAAMFNAPVSSVIATAPSDSAPLVLIADDNETIIELVADFLESKGYRVIATRSGFELLERAPELHPDIMLVDIQMPGLDGIETMRRVRAHSDPLVASTPMIALTALAMTGDREKCLQAGANGYMSKPIALVQMVEQIQKFLKKTTE